MKKSIQNFRFKIKKGVYLYIELPLAKCPKWFNKYERRTACNKLLCSRSTENRNQNCQSGYSERSKVYGCYVLLLNLWIKYELYRPLIPRWKLLSSVTPVLPVSALNWLNQFAKINCPFPWSSHLVFWDFSPHFHAVKSIFLTVD